MSSTPTYSSRERSGLLIGLAVFLHLVPLLLGAALIDPDEGLHAAIARQMVETGDWVIPRFLGTEFLDKPILYFWALAGSLAAFGDTEFAVRVPGAAFGLAGVTSTALVARSLFGRTSFAPAMFVATSLAAPFAVLLAPVHDVALVPLTTLTLWAFWRREHEHASRWWVLAAGAALGLSVLTKGLSGVALVGIAWGTYVLVARRLTWRAVGEGALVLAIAALVASPWYGAVERASPGYLHYFFVERHVMGFTTTTQNHGLQPWWFYLPVFLAGSTPWLGWIGTSVATTAVDWRARRAPSPAISFLLCWFLSNTLFLSAAGSKLLTYVLPTFPSLALLVVGVWSVGGKQNTVHGALAGRWLEGFTLTVLPLAVSMMAASFAPVSRARLLAASASALIGGVAWAIAHRPSARTLWPRALAISAVYSIVTSGVYAPVAEAYSARALAQHFNDSGRLPRRLFVFDERLGSLIFYLSPALSREATAERILAVDFGELRQAARTMTPGDIVAVPTRALPLVARSLPTSTLPYVAVGERYRLYSAPELLQAPGATAPSR